MAKKLKKIFLFFLILFILTELIARFALGLGDLPVYIEDKSFEYIYAPNQHVKRFGNRIITNEFSMRSRPLSKNDKTRILKLGDSVINGGSQTDHDSLASTILENKLASELKDSIRVLNAGANSWGPDNAFAYLEKHGHFDASMIVLVFSSHDLYDNMHFQKVVGVHPAWPSEKPFCAVSDGFFKYVMPWVRNKLDKDHNEYSYLGINSQHKTINPGWEKLFGYCRKENIELLVYLHPSRTEALQNRFDAKGKKIIAMMDTNKVEYITGLEHTSSALYYRDFIHLNNAGQEKMAQALLPYMRNHVKNRLKMKP